MGAVASGEIYQFKVVLIGISPPIWRRLQVADCTLAQFHRVLQVVMGWENYHLYMFRIGGRKYGPPDPDGLHDLDMVDAKRKRISASKLRVGKTFTYVYDFGDDWQHKVLLEAIVMPGVDATYPRCLAGERRCPPEDVGGFVGYAHYLEAIFDPNHAAHAENMMWRGPFDAEEFSLEKINQNLAQTFCSRRKTAPRLPWSVNTNRLLKTFIKPIQPQKQRIPIKADASVPLELSRRECDLIISYTFASKSLTNRLRGVPQPGQRPVFHFTRDELDELAGDVAAEANHSKNRVLQEQLDQLYDRIEGALSRYNDAEGPPGGPFRQKKD
jgi:hypothetical protein